MIVVWFDSWAPISVKLSLYVCCVQWKCVRRLHYICSCIKEQYKLHCICMAAAVLLRFRWCAIDPLAQKVIGNEFTSMDHLLNSVIPLSCFLPPTVFPTAWYPSLISNSNSKFSLFDSLCSNWSWNKFMHTVSLWSFRLYRKFICQSQCWWCSMYISIFLLTLFFFKL